MSLEEVPIKAGGGAKRNASLEPRAGGAGIHGNPESSNHHQAPSHWKTQWRYLPTSILTKTSKEGGANCRTKARFVARKNCMTFESEYTSSEAWGNLYAK